MKKIYSLLTVFAVFMFPLTALAAVSVAITDTSIQESNSISITIDTETDTLGRVALPIRHSEGVTITEVTPGTIDCLDLDYTESTQEENIVTVVCELDSATALNGVLANISFTSTDDSYTFEVFEGEEFDLDGLFLGETVNLLGNDTPLQADGEDISLESEEFLVTTQEGTPDPSQASFLDSITEYLPYILIGGSVILLISIVAILLGKKKGPKVPKENKGQQPESTAPIPPMATPGQGGEPSLKDMVNNPNSAPDQQQSPEMTPPIPEQVAPPTQEFTPPVSPASQEDDLQEILQRESAPIQNETPVQEAFPIEQPVQSQEVPFSAGFNAAPQTESPESIIPEAPVPVTGQEGQITEQPIATAPFESPIDSGPVNIDPNLQVSVNGHISEINSGIAPPPVETQQVPPLSSQNPEDLTGDLPPVPPTM